MWRYALVDLGDLGVAALLTLVLSGAVMVADIVVIVLLVRDWWRRRGGE